MIAKWPPPSLTGTRNPRSRGECASSQAEEKQRSSGGGKENYRGSRPGGGDIAVHAVMILPLHDREVRGRLIVHVWRCITGVASRDITAHRGQPAGGDSDHGIEREETGGNCRRPAAPRRSRPKVRSSTRCG